MVNDSHSTIQKVQDKKEIYTACDIKQADHARQFQNIADQPMRQILHAVKNNVLKNFQSYERISEWMRIFMGIAYHT